MFFTTINYKIVFFKIHSKYPLLFRNKFSEIFLSLFGLAYNPIKQIQTDLSYIAQSLKIIKFG